MKDNLDIPDFLRRPMTPTLRERLDLLNKERHVPSPLAGESIDFNKPKGMSAAEWTQVKSRRTKEKDQRHKVHLTRSKLRKQLMLAEAEVKRTARAAVASGARWNAVKNCWITQEDEMPKWTIVPYLPTGETDGIPAPNKRAISSIKEGTDRKELAAKVVAVALRSGKRTTKVEVTDSTGLNLLSTWTVDGDQIREGSDSFPLVAKQQEEPAMVKAKSKSKSSAKKLNGGVSRGVIIPAIKKFMARDRGTSVDECEAELKKQGIRHSVATIKKQLFVWHKSKERDPDRGVVYSGVLSTPRVKG